MVLQLACDEMRELIGAVVRAFHWAARRPSRPMMEVVELWPMEPSSDQ